MRETFHLPIPPSISTVPLFLLGVPCNSYHFCVEPGGGLYLLHRTLGVECHSGGGGPFATRTFPPCQARHHLPQDISITIRRGLATASWHLSDILCNTAQPPTEHEETYKLTAKAARRPAMLALPSTTPSRAATSLLLPPYLIPVGTYPFVPAHSRLHAAHKAAADVEPCWTVGIWADASSASCLFCCCLPLVNTLSWALWRCSLRT